MGSKHGRRHQKVSGSQHGGPARPPEHMERYLRDLDYPSQRDYLVAQAKARHAPPDVVNILARMPDHLYSSAAHVRRIATEEL